ncbi:MAG: nitroreductase [Atopobiaceae bacterium]|nr:nitroreductase [Atopobiaceae bacterium]
MNETLSTIRNRRSIRTFNDKPVPRDLVEQIAEAGIWAASGKNGQAPIVLVVTNPDLVAKLREMNRTIGGWSEGFDPFYGGKTVLVVLAHKDVAPTYLYDGSLVLGNMMLAAESLGVGSIWIHRAKQEFDSDEGKAILAELGIEDDDLEGIGHCVLGYTDEPAKDVARKEGRIFWAE